MDDFCASDTGTVSVEIVGRTRYIWRALGQDDHGISCAECRRDSDPDPPTIAFICLDLLMAPSSDLLDAVSSLDHLTSWQYRAALLFTFCRDRARVLPGHRLGLNLPTIPNMIAAVLRQNAAVLARAPLHAPWPDLESYEPAATQRFLLDYREYMSEIMGEISAVVRMYLALVPPLTIVEHMAGSAFEFTALFAQDLLMQALRTEFVPSTTHDDDFVLAYGRLIESRQMELHEEVIGRQMMIVSRKSLKQFSLLGACHDPPAGGYQTLFYDDGELRRVTFRTSSSIMNNCGLTAWPAGFLLAEYCIQHRPTGQRVLELGSGATGLVPTVCSRYQTTAVFATDFCDDVLKQLGQNLAVNDAHQQVVVRKLDWLDIDDDVLAETRPDIVLLADTIYSPDLIAGQVDVICRAFKLGAKMAIMANCLRQQSSFQLLKEELIRSGLKYEAIDTDSIQSRFYFIDRPDNIFILKVTPI